MIDEIDLHLHPVWKRRLVGFLNEKLPHFQIVATTHSPLTAQQAGPGELFVLRRESAKSSPSLYHYPGEPRTLMLHQLLMSPVFGLETVDSRQAEMMKQEYRRLRAKPVSRATSADKKRLTELRKELADLPDWTNQTKQDRKQVALLKEIKRALKSESKTRSPAR